MYPTKSNWIELDRIAERKNWNDISIKSYEFFIVIFFIFICIQQRKKYSYMTIIDNKAKMNKKEARLENQIFIHPFSVLVYSVLFIHFLLSSGIRIYHRRQTKPFMWVNSMSLIWVDPLFSLFIFSIFILLSYAAE